MNFYRLPPAGNRIARGVGVDEAALRGLFAPWEAHLFASGTAALAAALTALKRLAPERHEVLLPAYGCPNLLSAVLFAGCKPVLADLAPERPWLDLVAVEARLSAHTLAVVAVDLCGIPERYGRLREIAARHGAAIVQDAAQGFPLRAGDGGWEGDLVVLSFGRGKPVSLLGGGALLCRDRRLSGAVAAVPVEAWGESRQSHGTRVGLYNLLRHPRLYWLPSALPALRLGETRFEPLPAVGAMPGWLKRQLPEAVRRYRRNGPGPHYSGLFSGSGCLDLPRLCGAPAGGGMSRYPVLAPDGAMRDRLVERLLPHGAARLYPAPLPAIEGIGERLRADLYPNADAFAARLFTLPTHDGVRVRDVSAIARALRQQGVATIAGEGIG